MPGKLTQDEYLKKVIDTYGDKYDFSKIEYNYPADNNIVKESTGSYYYNMIPTMDGIHIYQFTGSGNVYAVEQSTFFVPVPPIVPLNYLVLWELVLIFDRKLFDLESVLKE